MSAGLAPDAPRLLYAGGSTDITPPRPVPLAGVESRLQPWQAVATPLEANALLLTQGDERVLLLTADLLYIGPLLVEAVQHAAAAFGIGADQVVLVASHTHFAPATDPTKPRLGAIDADYLAFARGRLEALVAQVASAPAVPVRIETARRTTDLNVNRRRRWPWPTWTRQGFRPGPTTVMAPVPDGPRDAQADVALLVDDAGTVRSVAWKFACHPVCFPVSLAVCAEFPGRARARLRSELGRDVPVLFWQGFTGDVRPNLPGARGWKNRLHALRRGPGFGEVDLPAWTAWADAVAALPSEAVAAPRRAVSAPLSVAGAALDMALVLQTSPQADPAPRPLHMQRVAFGDQLELLFVAAEVCSPYLARLGAGERTLCIGYAGHVFGYLPTERQVAEGGYEGGGFLALFGMSGAFRPGFEDAVVNTVERLRGRAAA